MLSPYHVTPWHLKGIVSQGCSRSLITLAAAAAAAAAVVAAADIRR